MNMINTIKNTFANASQYTSKARSRRQLLDLSDRQLADFGISRELLEEGVSAWPWRVENETVVSRRSHVEGIALEPSMADATIGQAARELGGYSDRKSVQLGIHLASMSAAQRAA